MKDRETDPDPLVVAERPADPDLELPVERDVDPEAEREQQVAPVAEGRDQHRMEIGDELDVGSLELDSAAERNSDRDQRLALAAPKIDAQPRGQRTVEREIRRMIDDPGSEIRAGEEHGLTLARILEPASEPEVVFLLAEPIEPLDREPRPRIGQRAAELGPLERA